MGQVLHGSATTTEAIRRAIQNSQESLRALSRRYGINQKTVAKWKKRTSVADLPTGPKDPRSTVLTIEEEAVIVAFRKYTLLPLDDCLYALQPTIPHLTRSSLHRCLQRHGISRLPEVEGDKPAKKKFKRYPIGFFHIDIAEVRTAEGKLYLFVAIDRTSKFAFARLVEKANRVTASDFLVALIEAVPYKIHTVLTDNGIQFRFPTRYANGHADTALSPRWLHEINYRLQKFEPAAPIVASVLVGASLANTLAPPLFATLHNHHKKKIQGTVGYSRCKSYTAQLDGVVPRLSPLNNKRQVEFPPQELMPALSTHPAGPSWPPLPSVKCVPSHGRKPT
jgi:hypothetical protein